MYACHNKPRAEGYWARDQVIWYSPHTVNAPMDTWLWIKDEMSKPCAYDNRATDPKCKGCNRE